MAEFPLRPIPAASYPEKIYCHLFIELPREFIGIYRILWKFISSGRAKALHHPTRSFSDAH
ncbi:MAG: hypothetical protein OXL41_06900, partial [Nitrospinae bacterium]|nr:hypothetical protein [Nitrospinota bacterium]